MRTIFKLLNKAYKPQGLTISDEKQYVKYRVQYILGYFLMMFGLAAYAKIQEKNRKQTDTAQRRRDFDNARLARRRQRGTGFRSSRDLLREMASPTGRMIVDALGDRPYYISMPDGSIYNTRSWHGDEDYDPSLIETFTSFSAAQELASMVGGKVVVATANKLEMLTK